MKRAAVGLVLVVGLLTGCRTAARHAALFEAAACNSDKEACVERLLDAHGGRERALKFRYATYTLRDHWDDGARSLAMPWPEQTTDIQMAADRLGYGVNIALGGTPYALGVDAQGAWGTGGKKGLPTVAARYGAGTSFVLSLPFRLLDPGTRLVEAKAARFQGKDTVALEVVWASDVARTPGDRWLLHINPHDYALDGVTYYAAEYKLTVDVRFDALLNVGGVLIPSYAVVSLWPLALRFHVVELLSAQLHTTPPEALKDGPPDADRAGEKWKPVR